MTLFNNLSGENLNICSNCNRGICYFLSFCIGWCVRVFRYETCQTRHVSRSQPFAWTLSTTPPLFPFFTIPVCVLYGLPAALPLSISAVTSVWPPPEADASPRLILDAFRRRLFRMRIRKFWQEPGMLRGVEDTTDSLSQGWGDQDVSWMFKTGLTCMNKTSVSLLNWGKR